MADLIVPIKYSYPVHFIRTRCRLMETAVVQADGVVVVQSATCAEAPSAFRVERACPTHTKPFEVRYYENSFWWPVGDDSGFATSVDFLRGLAEGNKHYLGLLDGKIVSHKGKLFSSEEHLRENIKIREIKMWGQDKIFAMVQKGAFELLLCDGVVHVKGGDPVICVRFMEATEAPRGVDIDIVDSAPAPEIGWYCPRPMGRAPALLENCASQGLVFRVDEFDTASAILSAEGAVVVRAALIENRIPESLRATSFDICVRAAARLLASWLSARTLPGVLPGLEILRSMAPILFQQTDTLQRSGKIQTLADALVAFMTWCEQDASRIKTCKDAYYLVKEAVERIARRDAALTPEDEAALRDIDC
jgi:hypothetical protein